MSWSIEEHIGECRPFPAQVVVYKGETDEYLAYVSGEVADRLKAENAKLRQMLKDLVIGIGKELCDYADKQMCEGCSMNHVNGYCVVTDAMEILEEDA